MYAGFLARPTKICQKFQNNGVAKNARTVIHWNLNLSALNAKVWKNQP